MKTKEKPLDPRVPIDRTTFKQQLIACGKKRCGTCGGTRFAHGPYWFAYWQASRNKKTKLYVGKILPAVAVARPDQCFELAKEIAPVRRTPTARDRAKLKAPAGYQAWRVPEELHAPALDHGFTFKRALDRRRARARTGEKQGVRMTCKCGGLDGQHDPRCSARTITIRCRHCTATWRHPSKKMAAGVVLTLLEHEKGHATPRG